MAIPLPILLLACTDPAEVQLDGAPPVETDTSGAGPCADDPCVAAANEDATVAYHRLVIDDDGVAWVSWVEVGWPDIVEMYVARSIAPGAPFDAITEVPYADPPITGGSERPGFAVSGDRVAVGYTGVGMRRHGDAQAVYVQLGTIGSDGHVSFDDAQLVETSDGGRWVLEQAQTAMGPGDEPWLLYKRQEYGIRDVPMLARESTGFVPEPVSEELSTLHDCSPPELQISDDGDPIVALRNNIDGTLQTVVVGPSGPVRVTDSTWTYNDAVCPEDGPRLARTADGEWVTVWIEPLADNSIWRSWSSTSLDGGLTWSEPGPAHDLEVGLGERNATVTAAGSGYVMGVESIDRTTRIWDYRGGGTGEVSALEAPGAIPLERVEIASGGGRTAAFGVGEDDRLWLVEVP